MIKILSAAQIKDADQLTIVNEPVSSIDLMERAAKACSDWITNNLAGGYEFLFFCGPGNNGADGLAVARLLYLKGKNCKAFIVGSSEESSENFKINLQRLKTLSPELISNINSLSDFPEINSNAIIVDAIYGSGLNKSLTKDILEIVKLINQSTHKKIISIDISSGLFADKHTENIEESVHPDFTLTFELPKQSFLYPEYQMAVGTLIMLPVNLDKNYLADAVSKNFLLSFEDISKILKRKPLFGHKGLFGHALLLAGSYGKAGAAILAAKACLRSGAGLLTVRVSEKLIVPLQTAVPEAMVMPDAESEFLSTPVDTGNYSAIGIGPGIGSNKETGNVLKRIIQDSKAPVVFDADALNLLSENKTWLSFIPPGSILTPHPGEFKRLAGNYPNPFDRSKAQTEFAKKYSCYVLLKGKYSSIACPDGSLIFNPTGNPGMATAGSGDALTGMITSFLAQGYSSSQAVILAVYLHGLAGDLAAENLTEHGMIASDIIEYIPMAFKEFR